MWENKNIYTQAVQLKNRNHGNIRSTKEKQRVFCESFDSSMKRHTLSSERVSERGNSNSKKTSGLGWWRRPLHALATWNCTSLSSPTIQPVFLPINSSWGLTLENLTLEVKLRLQNHRLIRLFPHIFTESNSYPIWGWASHTGRYRYGWSPGAVERAGPGCPVWTGGNPSATSSA